MHISSSVDTDTQEPPFDVHPDVVVVVLHVSDIFLLHMQILLGDAHVVPETESHPTFLPLVSQVTEG